MTYSDNGCSALTHIMRSSYAFAVMTCIFQGLSVLLVLMLLIARVMDARQHTLQFLMTSALASTICAFVCLTIAWPVSIHGRNQKHCGIESFSSRGYKIADGLALLISAWCVLVFEVIFAVLHVGGCLVDEKKPSPQPAPSAAADQPPAASEPYAS